MGKSFTGPLTFAQVDSDAGLQAAVKLPRAELIGTITKAGLKGRGGAGFTTGVKWNLCAAAQGEIKYVVCNADEGEPGTFKDRIILEDYPGLLIAGMTVAGYAVGAKRGIIYLRGEYAYLLPSLRQVLAERQANNLLGDGILGKEGFDFGIEVRLGAGAYVCGEETALIESLEGHRGEPRNRPPFPVDTGLDSAPTVVNNVETLCWAACIMAKGADWFKSHGTEKSPGLKLLSVSGDCERPGVYEFPLGVPIAEVLKQVGGADAKAVQVGGASGYCVPRAEFNRRIAFEDLPTGGSVIVFGPGRDMLRVARNFLEFFREESCGQCTPCREGCPVLLEGVDLLLQGKCSNTYLEELGRLGETMQLASKCGLGQSAPNAFLSITRHFSDEALGRLPTDGFANWEGEARDAR